MKMYPFRVMPGEVLVGVPRGSDLVQASTPDSQDDDEESIIPRFRNYGPINPEGPDQPTSVGTVPN